MFSFRRKPKQTQIPPIRATPSLPDITSQGIPWPEDLVDIAAIRESPPPYGPQQGAAKTSFPGALEVPIPFHKPFRTFSGRPEDGTPISAMYMSSPPSAFESRAKHTAKAGTRYTQRRARAPPTFNLMVVGGKRTGKSSLLRLLLETADISLTATADQRAAVERFMKSSTRSTASIQTASIEICESRFDRILFSVIDTPGLDFQEGKELKQERRITSIINYINAQYADTMSEESKVVRQNKGDQHIHLCIYLIDPSSIMTTAARSTLASLPTATRSETTICLRNTPDQVPNTNASPEDDMDDEVEVELTMSPAEIKVIRRLAERVNVLPVIAHADSLTNEKLQAVKGAVRRSLSGAGLGFGVFEMAQKAAHAAGEPDIPTTANGETVEKLSKGNGIGNGHGHASDEEAEETEVEERKSRQVIKLRSRSPRLVRNSSRSRSRRDLSLVTEDDRRPVSPDATDAESVANVRFSARDVARDLGSLLPFALIAPEAKICRERSLTGTGTHDGHMHSPTTGQSVDPSEDGHTRSSVDMIPQTPVSVSSKYTTFFQGPPENLRGVFVRRFRWGTIDVLDPDHCDFAALRTAVLSTHMKLLKLHTKEVLYEKFRTEKLLIRRATQNISEEQRKRLLDGAWAEVDHPKLESNDQPMQS
ncbi:hypothetical protein AMATHDRAFT_842 [Amanita thiersii Skay4041]|uniref:Septin-type G domain-containing protein n=1 Tax=Amanita thiersii Skay4041 TaxID=703135 RepID=A0A2A9NX60_9AGAR|nr:hypothetical protein AMATHDRAFT_842 [Amanita thiersii Skay4041]